MWQAISGYASRVEAASRTLLALVFLFAMMLDPAIPGPDFLVGYLLVAAYLAWSGVLLAFAWRSWWYDHLLARFAHVVDIAVFIGVVFATETADTDFNSPFLAFVAYLLVKARLRWNWRTAVFTALALIALYVVAVGAMYADGTPVDLSRLVRRLLYMVTLALVLLGVALGRRSPRPVRFPEVGGVTGRRDERMLAGAVEFAREALGAGGGAIAWSNDEEPWIELRVSTTDEAAVPREAGAQTTRFGPRALGEDFELLQVPLLFDHPRGRALTIGAEGAPQSSRGRLSLPLAEHLGVRQGLLLPLSCSAGSGQLLLWDLAPSSDDLVHGQAVAHEIERAFEHEQLAALGQASAVASLRDELARDLHDSVAQFFAGTQFRLAALRKWIRQGNDPDPEIVSVMEALRAEQAQLRGLIEGLRRGEESDRSIDLGTEIRALLGEVGKHWQVGTRFEPGAEPVRVRPHLSHEVRQIVREAVANAARHGHCREVRLALANDGDRLSLEIGDDGSGFNGGGSAVRPRSISERVAALGGRLDVRDAHPGVVLDIELPLRRSA